MEICPSIVGQIYITSIEGVYKIVDKKGQNVKIIKEFIGI
jgi:hypothetical protein